MYELRENIIKEYKGKVVNIKENIAVCKECGKDIFVPEIEDDNLKRLYAKYGELAGLIKPAQIIELREKYCISQREFCAILGWGKMTVNRYERGSLPSQSHSDILKLIIDNEEVFKQKVEEAFEAGRINQKVYDKVAKKFQDSTKNLKKKVINLVLKHPESIYNGFRQFDFERLENLISYIASKVDNLYQTSLNKYLWYIDFEAFKELIRSVVGIRYIKYDHGPVIEEFAYKDILNYVSDKFYIEEIESGCDTCVSIKVKSNDNYDLSIFSEEEIDIINRVIDRLNNESCNRISNLSHKEYGWIETNSRELISYDYAEKLKLDI